MCNLRNNKYLNVVWIFLKILVSEMVLKLYIHFPLFLEHLEREQNFCIYSILKPIFQIPIYISTTYLHRILLGSEKLISRFALVVTLWCRIVKFFHRSFDVLYIIMVLVCICDDVKSRVSHFWVLLTYEKCAYCEVLRNF